MKFKKLIMGALATLGLATGMALAENGDASRQAIAERLKPIGTLCLQGDECGVAAAPSAGDDGASGGDADGSAIYGSVCMACHDAGVAGAPKLGDAETWGPRIEKGTEELYASAINGIGAMPPKGGNPSLSDDDVKAAVDYMLESTQ